MIVEAHLTFEVEDRQDMELVRSQVARTDADTVDWSGVPETWEEPL